MEVDRDLETICLKCLEKVPPRRYASAGALAEDLERWLAGEAIEARPTRTWERLVKWTRRNPVLAGVSAGAVLIFSAGLAGVLSQWWRAETNAVRAEASASESRERLVRLNVANGVRLLDDGDHLASLVWFAEALKLDPGEDQAGHRLRIASVMRQCPRLLQMWFPGGPVHGARFSPNGQFVLATSGSNIVTVWSTRTGEAITPPLIHDGSDRVSAGFSPDSERVVSAGGDAARVWLVKSGQALLTLPHPNVRNAVFSPDGKWVATAGRDRIVRMWNAATGTRTVPDLEHSNAVAHVSFSPNGQHLLTFEKDNRIYLWDTLTGQPSVPSWKPDGIRHAEFNFDGSQIVTAHADGSAQVWHTATGLVSGSSLKDSTWLTHAAFSPDAKRVITSAGGHVARVWEIETGKRISRLSGHKNVVVSGAFSPSGERVITASFDGTARVFESATAEAVTPPLRHGGLVTAAQFHPDGQRVLTASSDGTVRLWSIWPQPQIVLPWADESRRLINVSPDGKNIILQDASNRLEVLETKLWQPLFGSLALSNRVSQAWVNLDRSVVLCLFRPADLKRQECSLQRWELSTAKLLGSASIEARSTDGVVPSPDYRHVAIFSGTRVKMLDSVTGQPMWPQKTFSAPVRQMKFAPDSRACLITSGSAVEVYNALSGERLFAPLEHSCAVSHAEFSQDSERIATSCSDPALEPREALVWNARTGQRLTSPLRHSDGVFHVAFSSDSRAVVTASEDGSARLWNAVTGEPLTPHMRHPVAVNHASCSPDGKWIATASHDKTARVWDARTGEPLTPRLKHPTLTLPWGGDKGVDLAVFLADGRHLLTRYSSVVNYIWELPSEDRPVDDLAALAGLLSGHRLDSTDALAPLESGALSRTWRTLRARYPQEFTFDEVDFKIPQRDARATLRHIDLGGHYNAALAEAFNFNSSAAAVFTPGLQVFGGTEFDLRGLVQLASREIASWGVRPFPEAVQKIAIGQSFDRLHLLHSTSGFDAPGTKVARLVLHYVDGQVREIPIVAGVDVDDWRPGANEPTRAKVVWKGSLRPTRTWTSLVQLFKSSWNNPRPEVPVQTIDYISTMSLAAPFLMGMTLEP